MFSKTPPGALLGMIAAKVVYNAFYEIGSGGIGMKQPAYGHDGTLAARPVDKFKGTMMHMPADTGATMGGLGRGALPTSGMTMEAEGLARGAVTGDSLIGLADATDVLSITDPTAEGLNGGTPKVA